VILHELAHFLVDRESQASHGPQFASRYLALVERFIGPEYAERLSREFARHHVHRLS
jgi:putative metallohydrolase (TIGR04338 family)